MKKEEITKGMRFEALNTTPYWMKGDRGTVIKVDDGDEDSKVRFDKSKYRCFYIKWKYMAPTPPAVTKGLKRTEVDAIGLPDGKVEVVAIRNVAFMKDIQIKYGKRVAHSYAGNYPHYMNALDESGVYVRPKAGMYHKQILSVGAVYTQKHFDHIIDTMKAAGDRLGELIREDRKRKEEEERAKKVKTIKI
jgi:hypothetical protein